MPLAPHDTVINEICTVMSKDIVHDNVILNDSHTQ